MPARNVVSSGLSNDNVRYSRLATDDDGYIDLQVRIHRVVHSRTTHLCALQRLNRLKEELVFD